MSNGNGRATGEPERYKGFDPRAPMWVLLPSVMLLRPGVSVTRTQAAWFWAGLFVLCLALLIFSVTAF